MKRSITIACVSIFLLVLAIDAGAQEQLNFGRS